MGKVQHGGFTRISLLLDCASGPLTDIDGCKAAIKKLIADNDMKVIGEMAVPSGTPGASGYQIHLILLESFVVTEVWPEIRRVKIVVDICDFRRPNFGRAVAVADGVRDLFIGPEMLEKRTIEIEPGVLVDEDELKRELARYMPES